MVIWNLQVYSISFDTFAGLNDVSPAAILVKEDGGDGVWAVADGVKAL